MAHRRQLLADLLEVQWFLSFLLSTTFFPNKKSLTIRKSLHSFSSQREVTIRCLMGRQEVDGGAEHPEL